jgi:hypothetical protein
VSDRRSGVFNVVPLPLDDERWRTTLRIERIRRDRDRWSAELTFAPLAFDPQYWLSRCEGFLVDSPEGAVGVVDEVLRRMDGGVDSLAVAGGWFGRRRHLISAREVEEIRPGAQRLVVRTGAAPVERPRGRARVPFNLLQRLSPAFDEWESEALSEQQRAEVGSDDEVVRLLGTYRAAR